MKKRRGVVMNPNEKFRNIKKNRDLLYVSCIFNDYFSNFFEAISSLTNLVMIIYSS